MPARNIDNSRLAQWRAGLAVSLVLCRVWAHAAQEPLARADKEAYTDQRYSFVVDRVLTPLEEQHVFSVIRYDVESLNLAELDEQVRRQDSQSGGRGNIAVLYPDISGPFQSVFSKIIEGIEAQSPGRVLSVPVAANVDAAEINNQLKRSGAKVVIALGRQGLKTAASLDRDMPVVVGGVLSVPEADSRNLTGISLTPDPALLFTRLKSLLPNVKRVFVVYDPQHNEWLMRLARDAAKAQGLELVTYEAHDLASALRLYATVFAYTDGRRDAIWLPQDSTTVDDSAVLPLVLRECWNRNVAFFSSSYLHVKKGALFTLYPNNVELGRTLAASALGLLSGELRKRGIAPLREMHTAINLRTASHIGLNISYQQQRSFDYVFPEP
jgi:putative ABC transport system substrate-binding protein